MNFTIVVVLMALMVGTGFWFFHRSRLRVFYEKGKREGELDRVILSDLLSKSEGMLQNTKSSVDSLSRDISELQEENTVLKRALAEAHVSAMERSNQSGLKKNMQVPARLIDGAIEILELKW